MLNIILAFCRLLEEAFLSDVSRLSFSASSQENSIVTKFPNTSEEECRRMEDLYVYNGNCFLSKTLDASEFIENQYHNLSVEVILISLLLTHSCFEHSLRQNYLFIMAPVSCLLHQVIFNRNTYKHVRDLCTVSGFLHQDLSTGHFIVFLQKNLRSVFFLYRRV